MYIKVKVTVQMRKDNKLKNFCCFQKGIPKKVINSLKDLVNTRTNAFIL